MLSHRGRSPGGSASRTVRRRLKPCTSASATSLVWASRSQGHNIRGIHGKWHNPTCANGRSVWGDSRSRGSGRSVTPLPPSLPPLPDLNTKPEPVAPLHSPLSKCRFGSGIWNYTERDLTNPEGRPWAGHFFNNTTVGSNSDLEKVGRGRGPPG